MKINFEIDTSKLKEKLSQFKLSTLILICCWIAFHFAIYLEVKFSLFLGITSFSTFLAACACRDGYNV